MTYSLGLRTQELWTHGRVVLRVRRVLGVFRVEGLGLGFRVWGVGFRV